MSGNEDRIIDLLESILDIQVEIMKAIRDDGVLVRREYTKNIHSNPMTQQEKDDIDQEIDLDWWYAQYGEDYRSAKAMDPHGYGYEKREADYIHKRLLEIATNTKPTVNGGTHVFTSVGKKYSKAEKNTYNCFACVPICTEQIAVGVTNS